MKIIYSFFLVMGVAVVLLGAPPSKSSTPDDAEAMDAALSGSAGSPALRCLIIGTSEREGDATTQHIKKWDDLPRDESFPTVKALRINVGDEDPFACTRLTALLSKTPALTSLHIEGAAAATLEETHNILRAIVGEKHIQEVTFHSFYPGPGEREKWDQLIPILEKSLTLRKFDLPGIISTNPNVIGALWYRKLHNILTRNNGLWRVVTTAQELGHSGREEAKDDDHNPLAIFKTLPAIQAAYEEYEAAQKLIHETENPDTLGLFARKRYEEARQIQDAFCLPTDDTIEALAGAAYAYGNDPTADGKSLQAFIRAVFD